MPTNRLIVKEQVATYTRVLFDAARERGVDTALNVREQARAVLAAIRGNAELAESVNGSAYESEQRAQIMRGVFSQCDPALLDVLAVMAERGEVDYLSRVVDGYDTLLADEMNLVVVEVTTAVPLDDHLRGLVKEKAERELGKNVVLAERVDRAMLGGIIMSTRDERIDASVLTQVEKARTVLRENK